VDTWKKQYNSDIFAAGTQLYKGYVACFEVCWGTHKRQQHGYIDITVILFTVVRIKTNSVI